MDAQRFNRAAMLPLAIGFLAGCSVSVPDLDDQSIDGARRDGASTLDGRASLDAGRYPDGAPIRLDGAPPPRIGDASLGDVALLDGAAMDGALDASIDAGGRDAMFEAGRFETGPAWDGAHYTLDGRVPLRETGVFVPDTSPGGIACGGGICPQGFTCCPVTGMCVPFGCPECCMIGPPPPPPPPSF